MIPLYLEHDVSQLGSRDYIPGEKWDEIQREGDSERFSAEGEIDSDRSPAYFYRGEAGLTRLNAFIEPRDRFGYVVALPKSGAMPLSLSLSLSRVSHGRRDGAIPQGTEECAHDLRAPPLVCSRTPRVHERGKIVGGCWRRAGRDERDREVEKDEW